MLFMQAVESARKFYPEDDEGEHMERVSSMLNGYKNIRNDMGDE